MIRRIRLFKDSFSLDSIGRKIALAIVFNRLPSLLATTYVDDYQQTLKTRDWLTDALPLIPVAHLAAISNHPFFSSLIEARLVQYALGHEHPTLLRILARSERFLESGFERIMYQASIATINHPQLASLTLAAAADRTIANESWSDYAEGIVTACRMGGPKWLAWAYNADLPVIDCLPIKEAITNSYGTIPNTATFNLLMMLANATSAHERIDMRSLLQDAGETPEDCFMNPSATFTTLCTSLET